MSIRKRGKKYCVELRPKSRPAIFGTFLTRGEALLFEAEQRILMKSGTSTIKRTLSEAIDRYMTEITPQHKGARWEAIRLNKFKRDPIARADVDEITADDIDAWIENRKAGGLKNNSIRRELGLLGAVLRMCVKWRYARSNPVALASKPKMDRARERRIEKWETERICERLGLVVGSPIKTTSQAAAGAFLFAIETAMRQGEIFGMRWEDVHLMEHYVHLPDSKNGDSRDVPLSSFAELILNSLPGPKKSDRVFPFNQSSCSVIFLRAVRNCGIKNLTFHDSRHEACSRLAMIQGMDPVKLCKITGHRDSKSLLTYFNPRAAELVRLVRGSD